MLRLRFFSLCGTVLLLSSSASAANPPDATDSRFNKALEVQAAMVRARTFLREQKGEKAVEVLEEQLAKVNGNMEYLVLLRDAYRAYIRDLHLAGRPDLAQRYLDRLCILDPAAMQDSSLRSAQDTTPRKFEPEPARQAKTAFPNFKLSNPFARKEEPKNPPLLKTKIIRAQAEEGSATDPFDIKNQRSLATKSASLSSAQELLALGAEAFRQQRYSQAESYFEQACLSDPACLEVCRDQLAYCILKGVSDQVSDPLQDATRGKELQQQVERAMRMVPGNARMNTKGQELLQQIEQRARQNDTAPQVSASLSKVKHWGENREGWQVTETEHFRIFHRQNNEYAEQVAQIAEKTHLTMYRKWFGMEGMEWHAPCELILHATASGYSQMTGVPTNSPGHSRIESDPSGRVIARRMDLRHDIHGMMDAVLPHETTHVVLAGMFGTAAVPRWVDEGIAVLSEPNDKVDLHRRNLVKNHQEGNLFGLRELMELKDYPQPRRIGAFYAQSVVLVEFLSSQKGAKVFTDFVKDGLRHGYEAALQQHYQLTYEQLEQQWQQQVLNNPQRFAAKK